MLQLFVITGCAVAPALC